MAETIMRQLQNAVPEMAKEAMAIQKKQEFNLEAKIKTFEAKFNEFLAHKFSIAQGLVIQQYGHATKGFEYKIDDSYTLFIKVFFPGFKRYGPGKIIELEKNGNKIPTLLIYSKQSLQLFKRRDNESKSLLIYKFVRPQILNRINPEKLKGLKAIIVKGREKIKDGLVNKIKVIKWAENKKSILVEILE